MMLLRRDLAHRAWPEELAELGEESRTWLNAMIVAEADHLLGPR